MFQSVASIRRYSFNEMKQISSIFCLLLNYRCLVTTCDQYERNIVLATSKGRVFKIHEILCRSWYVPKCILQNLRLNFQRQCMARMPRGPSGTPQQCKQTWQTFLPECPLEDPRKYPKISNSVRNKQSKPLKTLSSV